MKEVKWAKESNKEQTVRIMAMQHNIANPTKYTHAELVDKVNRALAKKNGVEVPEELILIKRPVQEAKPSAPKTEKKERKATPKTIKERKAKEATPVLPVPDGLVVLISGRPMKDGKVILANRKMLVTGIKGDNLLGQLLHEKTNDPQRSVIAMPIQFTDYKPVAEAVAAQ